MTIVRLIRPSDCRTQSEQLDALKSEVKAAGRVALDFNKSHARVTLTCFDWCAPADKVNRTAELLC